MPYFIAEKLSANMSMTPEGFLLCENVPIARTGEQIYLPEEVPVAPGPDGLCHIFREADEVFDPHSIASLQGKSFTNGHPPEGVDPKSWQELTVGIVLNPRRGTGIHDNAVVADVQVTNELAQALIHAGKREVSGGYDCGYVDLGGGKGKQFNIRYNHVALVEMGRCGAECRIGDENPEGVIEMKKWLEQLKAAFTTKDEAKIKTLLETVPTGDETSGVHLHIGESAKKDEETESAAARSKWNDEAIEKKFGEHEKMMGDNHKSVMDAIGEISKKLDKPAEDAAEEKEVEGALKEEAPAGTGDARMKDSAPLQDIFRATVSMAEIIAPGIHVPTFDSAMAATKTYKNICGLRRKALTLGANDSATNGMIESALGRAFTNDSLEKMDCGQVRTLFFAVGALKRTANNAGNAGDGTRRTADAELKRPLTLADINARNEKFYAGQSAK
jgi:hypothetical protein